MKRLFIALTLSCAFAVPAQGEGALAVAIHDRGMREAFAYAWHLRAAIKEDAQKEALEFCRAHFRNM